MTDCDVGWNTATTEEDQGDGGGIAIDSFAVGDVTVAGTLVHDNRADGGGGISDYSDRADLIDAFTAITSNESEFGGGLLVLGSVYGNGARVSGNEGDYGAGLAEGVVVEGLDVVENHATFEGGGAYAGTSPGSFTVFRDTTFEANTSDGEGAAVFVEHNDYDPYNWGLPGVVTFDHATIVGHPGPSSAIYNGDDGVTLNFVGGRIEDNHATGTVLTLFGPLVAFDTAIVENVGSLGAIGVGPSAELDSNDVDLGYLLSDNAPHDLYDLTTGATRDLGTWVTLSCTGSDCF